MSTELSGNTPPGDESLSTTTQTTKKPLWKSLSTEVLFFSLIAGMSVLGGFGMTLTMAKKRDPNWFAKGLLASREISESGGSLALRALGLGSLYAVGGFSVCCLLAWKISGVHSMEEMREKVGRILPPVPRHEPRGRSEFKSLRDLVNYLIEEDELKKTRRKDS